MSQIDATRSSTHPRSAGDSDRSRLPRQLMIFLAVALGVSWPLLTLSTLIEPDAPFLIAAVLLGLALPALLVTYRQAGRAGARGLLRECVRLPTRWWWLLLAAFGLPAATWAIGAALGGAQPLTWGVVAFYTADLIIGARMGAPLTVGGALLFFGGWWVLSAKKWFKGPVRMGTDEELEQLEEEQLGAFDFPTEEPA